MPVARCPLPAVAATYLPIATSATQLLRSCHDGFRPLPREPPKTNPAGGRLQLLNATFMDLKAQNESSSSSAQSRVFELQPCPATRSVIIRSFNLSTYSFLTTYGNLLFFILVMTFAWDHMANLSLIHISEPTRSS